MGLRLRLLNAGLRLLVKPMLRRMGGPVDLRRVMERAARRGLLTPDGAHFNPESIRRPDAPPERETMPVIWASCGRPDRRRVVLYLHGGAYVAGSPRTHKHLAAALGGAAGVRVIVPDYALAPEHPFPAALDDAETAYRHLIEAGYSPSEIAIAGDSAGGGLGFCLLVRLRRRGMPLPACIVGFSPWADMTGESETLRTNAVRDVMLPVSRMDEAIGFFMDGHDRTDPEASPVLADWQAPPPALIMASRHEILLGDSVRLAEAIRKGGGDVQLDLWRSTPHAWPIFTGWLPEADHAVETAGAFIARHLGSVPD